MSRRFREDAHLSYHCCCNSLMMKQRGRTKIVLSVWHLSITKCITEQVCGIYIYGFFKKLLWQYMKQNTQKMVFQLDECSQTEHICVRKQILTPLQELPSSSLSVTTTPHPHPISSVTTWTLKSLDQILPNFLLKQNQTYSRFSFRHLSLSTVFLRLIPALQQPYC